MNPYAEYDALPGVRWSHLKHLLPDNGSPLHYRHAVTTPDTDTTSRMVGRALHTLVLQPERWDEDYAIFYDGDRRGRVWEAFRAENRGRTILKPNEYDLVKAQSAAIRQHPEAALVLLHQFATTEQPITWTDPETGIACKGLVDALNPRNAVMADLKGACPLPLFPRLAMRQGYYHQLASYRRGVRISLGVDCEPYLVAVECKPPHDVGVFRPSPALIDLAEREIVGLMATLARCLETDRWPGRYPEVEDVEVPAWKIEDPEIPEEGVGDVD